jgi:hypothetical protein
MLIVVIGAFLASMKPPLAPVRHVVHCYFVEMAISLTGATLSTILRFNAKVSAAAARQHFYLSVERKPQQNDFINPN